MEGGEEVKCFCLEGDSFSFFYLLAPLDSASDPLGLCLTKKLSSAICFSLILSFRFVLYVVCFLLGNSPASEF